MFKYVIWWNKWLGEELITKKKTETKLISDVLHKPVDHLGLPNDLVNQLTRGTTKLATI
jgi:hypothetical protein